MVNIWVKRFAIFTTLIALFTNIYIYTYPSFNVDRCTWGYDFKPRSDVDVLSRVYNYFDDVWKHFNLNLTRHQSEQVRILAVGDPQLTGIWHSTPYIKRLDIYGNDWYLSHIFRMMETRLRPTHVAVMGDILSSQWIGDSEFLNRTKRFSGRLLGRNITRLEEIERANRNAEGVYQYDWKSYASRFRKFHEQGGPYESKWDFKDVWNWDTSTKDDYLLINITGNHDIGYAGDVTYQHMARYLNLYGSDNYWIEYDLETEHPWRIVVLNDMLLEGPALQPEFIEATWNFLFNLQQRSFNGSTILITHIPFYKPKGICVDGPEFRYYPSDYENESYKANLLRSQNHLSEEVTQEVFNHIFTNGKPGVILTGHDHEGCETYYTRRDATWIPSKSLNSSIETPHIREITVRSIMGDYGGTTGLLMGQFNRDKLDWDWSYSTCPFVVQHVWWASKISVLFALLTWPVVILL